jgi:hypothetical protein
MIFHTWQTPWISANANLGDPEIAKGVAYKINVREIILQYTVSGYMVSYKHKTANVHVANGLESSPQILVHPKQVGLCVAVHTPSFTCIPQYTFPCS